MIVLPAIDLKDGKVVRLYKGNFDTVHQVSEDPLATAEAFASAGARYIHMVDLDGARSGARKNGSIVQAVAERSGLRVELGGGIRSMADLEAVFALGVYRAVIGSAAVSDPAFVRAAVERYGERIAVGIDALDGIVKTAGWEQSSGLDYVTFAKQMGNIGVKTIIFTDIATDGMLSGPSLGRLGELQRVYSGQIVASGGVSSNQDIRDLAGMGLYGAIVGKAYYAGTIDLAAAVADAGTAGMKIAVIGYSGSGKSTLSQRLGGRYGIPVLHMDRVHHAPGWGVRDRDEARQMVLAFMERPDWVIDGNYTNFFYERRMAEADSIVFLDLPRLSCFVRAVRRFFRYRGRTREDMAEGCTEKMDLEFMRWLLWDGRGRQKKRWLEAGLDRHWSKVTVLNSQRQIDAYLEELSC